MDGLPDSLAGKHIAITGCTSGTGLVLAKKCGALGAHVLLINRDSARAKKAADGLKALVRSHKYQLQSHSHSTRVTTSRMLAAISWTWRASERRQPH
jgi:NAD(P)-dependent dehydrogenase (short-subunit alcohol dehydrogenase family)